MGIGRSRTKREIYPEKFRKLAKLIVAASMSLYASTAYQGFGMRGHFLGTSVNHVMFYKIPRTL